MSDARKTRYDRRRRSCRTNSEFDSIRGEYRFFECRKTGSQTESKNRFIRFFPYRYTTLICSDSECGRLSRSCPLPNAASWRFPSEDITQYKPTASSHYQGFTIQVVILRLLARKFRNVTSSIMSVNQQSCRINGHVASTSYHSILIFMLCCLQ